MPPGAVDAHAHLFRRCDASPAIENWLAGSDGQYGYECYRRRLGVWLGDRRPAVGVFFALPVKSVDFHAANQFVLAELHQSPGSCGLLMVGPADDPAVVDDRIANEGWAGFKPYHLFARCSNTYEATIEEFVPEWCWEIAHRRELAIMLHLVRSRALADESNQQSLSVLCRRYPGAKVILAHAGRGFCARHTVEGAAAVAGLENVYFDTSAICESTALETVLRTMGPGRLLFGTDFPVSEMRGKCVSVGDGFAWLDESSVNWASQPFAKPELVGLESVAALQQACWLTGVTDTGVERIFRRNALSVFKLAGCNSKTRVTSNSEETGSAS